MQRAISKHGANNFTKEILHVFESEAEMNAKEKELVEVGPHTYNLCPGGQGGFGYINTLYPTKNKGIPHTTATRKKIGVAFKGKVLSAEHKAKVSAGLKGRKLSEETKEKIRLSKLGKPGKNKGQVPWNKGLSKETDTRVQKYAAHLRGRTETARSNHPGTRVPENLEAALDKRREPASP